jgi:hypothetical protein
MSTARDAEVRTGAGEAREEMSVYEFTLRISRQVTEDEADALYDVFNDGSVVSGVSRAEIEFAREARNWAEAIGSAIRDVESVPGLVVAGAGQEDLVSIADIAHRARRSREAVRLWAAGKRGAGGFPYPAWQSPGGERFWSWSEVARWIRATLNLAVQAEAEEVRWADEVLKARLAVAEAHRILDEDEDMRAQLGPLLGRVAC